MVKPDLSCHVYIYEVSAGLDALNKCFLSLLFGILEFYYVTQFPGIENEMVLTGRMAPSRLFQAPDDESCFI